MKIALREKMAVGCADFANSLTMGATLNYLLYFYTDVVGLAAASAGTLLLGTRVIDGVVDIVIGAAADRTHTRWGKYRPWILWVSAPVCVSMILVFTQSPWQLEGRLIYAWATYLVFMVVLSAMNVPLNALAAVMTDDAHERTSINGIRQILAGLGIIFISAVTVPLVEWLAGPSGNQATGYQWTMSIYGTIAFALLVIAFLGTRERIQPPAGQRDDLRADLAMMRRNYPWMIVLAAFLVLSVLSTLRGGVVLYYFNYYVGWPAGAAVFLTVMSAGGILGAAAAAPISRRWGKRTAFMLGSMTAGVFCCLTLFLRPSDAVLLEVFNFAASAALGLLIPLMLSMMADTADYGEWRCGRRATGLTFAGVAFGFKAGIGVGGALTGFLLAAFGYVKGGVQGEQTIEGIAWLLTAIPGIGFLLLALLIRFYPLDEEGITTIRSDLRRRQRPRGLEFEPAGDPVTNSSNY